jgi:hypothetical protein
VTELLRGQPAYCQRRNVRHGLIETHVAAFGGARFNVGDEHDGKTPGSVLHRVHDCRQQTLPAALKISEKAGKGDCKLLTLYRNMDASGVKNMEDMEAVNHSSMLNIACS